MANSDKDILITPNKGTTSIPEINFVGQVNSPIKLRVLDDNTLSFEGSAGQLFSINNNLTSGTIFAASDISGVPGIALDANGTLRLSPFSGGVAVGGNGFFTATSKLHVRSSSTADGAGPVYLERTALTQECAINWLTNGVKKWWLGTDNDGTDNCLAIYKWDGTGSGWVFSLVDNNLAINSKTPTSKLNVVGEHGTTQLRLTLPAVNNGSGTGVVNLQAWVSEPGITWNGGGFGMNVTNYYRNINNTDANVGTLLNGYTNANNDTYFPRFNTNLGQAYIRFYPGGGNGDNTNFIDFITANQAGTYWPTTMRVRDGCVAMGGIDTNTAYRLNVNGNINFTGQLYQNGSVFRTLPTQSAATIGATLRSDGTNAFWDNTQTFTATFADGTSSSTFQTLPYAAEDRYRVGFQITRGYAMGGYQNSTSYRNVCSINHGTITLQNHGDLLTNGQGYCAGGRNSSMHGYVFIAVNGVGGTGRTCSKINMNNNTNLGTVNISIDRSSTTIMQRDFKFAYVYGGGDSRPDKFNYATDTSALIANGNPEGNVNNPAGGYGATYGWTKNGSGYNFSWAAETYAVWPNAPGTDGTNKTLSARHGFAYWNTAGGYTTAANLSKRSLLTGAEATQVFKFNSGEETWHTGMSKGFMCGMYNGAQNNTGIVVDYAAETFVANSNINRVGPPGSASGAGTEFGALLTGYDGI